MMQNIIRDKAFYRNVAMLSWPVMTQNLLNHSLAFLDSFMVGSLGERYLSSVSLANTVFFMTMLTLFGLQSGSSVLISQYYGKGDNASINRVMGIGFGLSLLVTVPIALMLSFFSLQVYSLTSNDMELAIIAAEFGRIAAPSIVFNAISILYLAAHRSMENPRVGMYILGCSMALKTFLNWVLIFGMLGAPAMGIRGAALATLLARIFEFIVTFSYALLNKRFRLLPKALFRPGKIILKDYLKYSLPVVINEAFWGFGASLYTVIFGHLHNAMESLATYAIVMNVERMVGSLHSGLGHVAAILVGKELGAGRKESAFKTGVSMMAVTTGTGVLSFLLLASLSHVFTLRYIFPLFGASAQTIEIGGTVVLIGAALMPFRAFNFCGIVGLLRGGGDARGGMVIDVLCMYLVAIPLAALAGLVLQAPTHIVFLMVCMDELTKAFCVLWRLRQRKWLQNITR